MKDFDEIIQKFYEPIIQIDSLPHMNMQDLKLNIAGMMSAYRDDAGQTEKLEAIWETIGKLRLLLDKKQIHRSYLININEF